MIFIETINRIVLQLLLRKSQDLTAAFDEKCGDFNNSAWHIISTDDTALCKISLKLGGGATVLRQYALAEHLKEVVPEVKLLAQEKTEEGYDFTFKFDPTGTTPETCNKVASLRYHVMTPPFKFAFEQFDAGESFDPIAFDVRDDESIEISVQKDNLIVQYTMSFANEDDLMSAKILLQEFVDVKKHEKSVSAAPGFNWKFDEAKQAVTAEFVIFKTHTNAKNRDKTIEKLLAFRTYVHYHLMCSKSYIHTRMRTRVEESLKVLNRAKTHSTGQAAELIK